ncbi:MAG TPA: glycoside hydrolase family 38 C-terminal domain-containing protein [Kribbella sp.]|uniref:alpha-mannosidase n=1 Tax=Kribbella sp. TaxID=1871183 RepID=UPI002D78C8E5|nr:glycoside hydrolase family 38 C-terminal domain-containing protein [Kribbella sp.]HET6293789.1 glycoside hydrolase family 38 C-terminal domain-containing protein [Kribbella sp.]
MHDDRSLIEERLKRALRERIRPAIYGAAVPLDIEVWHAPGEPVTPAEALAAAYEPAEIGLPWGPAWGTAWFHFSGQVPAEWAGREIEAVIDLGFSGGPGFSAEGLVHTTTGVPLKGLHPRQTYAPLSILGPDGTAASAGDRIEFYVEAAANPEVLGSNAFAPTDIGSKPEPGGKPIYQLARADLAVFNAEVWDLVLDLDALDGLQKELSPQEPRRKEILRALSRALDVLDYEDVAGTASDARAELTEVLSRPAHASAHQLSAVGHAHIDSAWLWPLRETRRKVARTVSNVATLAQEYPELVFAFSQAQQHAWVKDNYPEVWERLKKAVADGTIVPVGGMWVESDTNLPGGEALARQFVHGKRFFLDEYGIDTQEVWLPDSFGYTAALPQLVKLSGSKWFLTQKISWNRENKFPHHTFFWEGLDGTRVFTHFPPIDTYNSDLSGRELAHAQRNFAENGAATRSLVPFGYGDGGGGPTREFIATARRVANLESSPRVTIESPTEFFSAAEEEYPNAPVWSGELYLEIHRATYTSQAKTKQGNRRSEHLLREAELWSTAAVVAGKLDSYPYEDLDRIWKAVLLNQFHDILPGSSISWVHREAEATYKRLAEELEAIIAKAQQALAGEGSDQIVFNAAPHSRGGVAGLGAGVSTGEGQAATIDGNVLDNGLIRVTIDDRGLITSLYDVAADREVVAPGSTANLLQLHVDTPNHWDAWDVDSFYKNNVRDVTEVDTVDFSTADGVATVVVTRSFNRSSITQTLRLRPGVKRVDIETSVDWHESEKFLKAAFPVDVHADRSASETQFGHIFRPTHQNTSWDAAKFEIAAHRWVHVGEPGYGVAVVNDSTYGHDINRTAREDGGTTTTIRTSLIRAPRFPDPHTDQGVHVVNHALVVGAGIPEAIEEGYRINLPERIVSGAAGADPILAVDNGNVIVEAVKLADDQSGDVVVRLYESSGGRSRATVTPGFAAASVTEVDLLERHLADHDLKNGGVSLDLRPFQILTLRFTR